MKALKKILAMFMAAVLFLSAIPVAAAQSDAGEEKILYTFDLEDYLREIPTSKIRYDYMKLATALQGLANRTEPQLWLFAPQGDEAINAGWNMDTYWLTELRQDDGFLSGYTIQSVADFWQLFTIFEDCYNGIVLWDESVPATANVASTIAGVENLLPVRYATGEKDVYTLMQQHGFSKTDVKKTLVGKFTGNGTIPDSQTVSTGSAKDDAYIWAKENYLDKGLTNAELMTYALDGGTWALEDDTVTENDAVFVSQAFPDEMEAGEIVPFSVTIRNSGTSTWTRNTNYRLGLTKIGEFGFYTSETGDQYDASNKDRLKIGTDVGADEQYRFVGFLKAPETPGNYDMTIRMVQDGSGGWFGKNYTHGILVTEKQTGSEETENPQEAAYTAENVYSEGSITAQFDGKTETLGAAITQVLLPDYMRPGEAARASITVKNTGTKAWGDANSFKLGLKSGGFTLWRDADGTVFDSGNKDRIKRTASVAPGETYTFDFYLKAPEQEAAQALVLSMVNDANGGWFGGSYGRQIVVTGTANTPLRSFEPETVSGVSGQKEVDGQVHGAEVIAAALPTSMKMGETVKASVTVKNTGTETWTNANGYKLGLAGGSFRLCTAADDSVSTDSGDRNRIKPKQDIQPGEIYTFSFYLKAPAMAGEQNLQLKMINDSKGGWFDGSLMKQITVTEESTSTVRECMEEPVNGVSGSKEVEGEIYGAEVTAAALPTSMKPGEIVKCSVTVKNTGTKRWENNGTCRLGVKSGEFKLCTSADGRSTDSGNKDRIKPKQAVEPNESYVFEFYLQAPETTAVKTLALDIVDDQKGGWFGCNLSKSVLLSDMGVLPAEKQITGAGVVYGSLFKTCLLNADYYIAKKAFFWDLSPDASIPPLDDRTQPVGSDVATLKSILLSQAQQALTRGTDGIYTVGGFVPWWIKYTSYSDKQSIAEVEAEWTMVDIISSYHGQVDADAYGTTSMSNASIFTQVPLNEELRQNNDKGESNTLVYDENTAYLMFYMGDWDGSAWVNGILPFIWQRSREDSSSHVDRPLPLAWPINSCLADRIPQMYNMLYETAGTDDYFVTGDNGTGYLNPMCLEGEYVPEGLENFLNVWKEHNILANQRFDLDICGFLIPGMVGSMSETARAAQSEMTPVGVVGGDYETYGNTPFCKMTSLSNMRTDAEKQEAAKQIASHIKFDGQFFCFRSVKASRADVRRTLELLDEQNPGIRYEVVDPYTFFSFYKEHRSQTGTVHKETYSAPDTEHAAITINGVVGETEWADAPIMTVSTRSEAISRHGYIWGDIAGEEDLKSEYRIKWDADNLYLLEERTDDQARRAVGSNGPKYDVDASMLFLDLDGKQDGSKFFEGDYAVHYTLNSDNVPVVWLRYGDEQGNKHHRLLESSEYTFGVTLGEGGSWTVELAIPWSIFGGYTPESAAKAGMTVLAIDHDDGTSGGRQIMWHGNGDTQANWGMIMF